MHREDGFVRARTVTFGLAGISLAGVIAVAGVAHGDTVTHRNPTPTPTTTDKSPTGTRSPSPAAAKTSPKSTPRPHATQAKHHATSGGS